MRGTINIDSYFFFIIFTIISFFHYLCSEPLEGQAPCNQGPPASRAPRRAFHADQKTPLTRFLPARGKHTQTKATRLYVWNRKQTRHLHRLPNAITLPWRRSALSWSACRRGSKGRLAKGRLAKGRKQRGLKHEETYRTPIVCTVPLPKLPLVPSKHGIEDKQYKNRRNINSGETLTNFWYNIWKSMLQTQETHTKHNSASTHLRVGSVCIYIYIYTYYIYIYIHIYLYLSLYIYIYA